MGNGDDEEAVAVVGQTSQGVVPGGESSEETEESTSLLDATVGDTGIVVVDVSNTQQEEGQIQGEEQGEEGNSGAEGAEDQDGGEDEPAHQEETHGVCERDGPKTRLDFEATRGQNNGKREPETAVRGESSGTEGVTNGHFPGISLVDASFHDSGDFQKQHTTCRQAAGPDHRNRKQDRKRCWDG